MNRGPQTGIASTADFMAIAREAWCGDVPPEVIAMAQAAQATTARAVAEKLGYSPAVFSHVLRNNYTGDMARVFEKIRGALMGETVECPVLGDLPRHTCLNNQRRGFAATSSTRARLYHACPKCPNRLGGTDV